jgi:hypothetical protein
MQTAEHILKPPAGHGMETLRLQGIQADVHPRQTSFLQSRSHRRQKQAICGQGDLRKTTDLFQSRNQRNNVFTEQGFAPRQANPVNSFGHRRANNRHDLLERKQFLASQIGRISLPSAIYAPQIASVRHRDPKIIYLPTKLIQHSTLSKISDPPLPHPSSLILSAPLDGNKEKAPTPDL